MKKFLVIALLFAGNNAFAEEPAQTPAAEQAPVAAQDDLVTFLAKFDAFSTEEQALFLSSSSLIISQDANAAPLVIDGTNIIISAHTAQLLKVRMAAAAHVIPADAETEATPADIAKEEAPAEENTAASELTEKPKKEEAPAADLVEVLKEEQPASTKNAAEELTK